MGLPQESFSLITKVGVTVSKLFMLFKTVLLVALAITTFNIISVYIFNYGSLYRISETVISGFKYLVSIGPWLLEKAFELANGAANALIF